MRVERVPYSFTSESVTTDHWPSSMAEYPDHDALLIESYGAVEGA